jgi:soluble lytic murein transglycosylase
MDLTQKFANDGFMPQALRIAEYRRVNYSQVAERRDLELMYPRPYADTIEREAVRRQVPVELFYSLLRTESLFDPRAVSPVGAQGIAQFMPATAAETAKAMRMGSYDVFEPETAIAMSAHYLAQIRRPVKNWSRAIAAYNAGAGRIRQQVSKLPTDQFLFNEGLAIAETRNYIRRIIENSIIYAWLYTETPDLGGVIGLYLKED